jgi:hypothetical protein
MAANYDATEFVDTDFMEHKSPQSSSPAGAGSHRAPTREEDWSKENFNVELTRALTAVENARMEWNSARLKVPVLDGENAKKPEAQAAPPPPAMALGELSFGQLCKFGLALTWPLLIVALGALGVFIAILLRH